jgi:hypothetical protein
MQHLSRASREWKNRDKKETLDSNMQRASFKDISENMICELLELNRNYLNWVTGLFIGHSHLKGHIFELGLTNNPTCKRRMDKITK